jgi:hypothetical protein
VAVLNFTYDEEDLSARVAERPRRRGVLGQLKMVFLQMPLFRLTEPELKTRKDKWMYFLKNLEDFDEIPTVLCGVS